MRVRVPAALLITAAAARSGPCVSGNLGDVQRYGAHSTCVTRGDARVAVRRDGEKEITVCWPMSWANRGN